MNRMSLRLGSLAMALATGGAGVLAVQSDVAFPPEVYAARRARLAEQLGGAPVIVPGAYLIANGGEDRQDANFFYLTGVESPYAVLVMSAGPASPRPIRWTHLRRACRS